MVAIRMLEARENGDGADEHVELCGGADGKSLSRQPFSLFENNPTVLIGGQGTTGWEGTEMAFSQIFTNTCKASSRAIHSILKEHMLPGCNVPPSIVVSVVLLYLAIILHLVDELPLYLQPRRIG